MRFFFRLSKTKARMRAPIGPFTNNQGKLIEKEPFEVLNQTYYKVYEQHEEKYTLPEDYLDSAEDLPQEEDKRLKNIFFRIENIKNAIKETKSEAPGPSGITPSPGETDL